MKSKIEPIQALRQIKRTALTTTDGRMGLAHIVRLCIDAGIKEKLEELERDPRDFLEWTKQPPSEQGEYWWWNEDEDSLPLRVSVLYSGTSGTCFAAMGQHGWTRAQKLNEMGGYWMRSEEPPLPVVRG